MGWASGVTNVGLWYTCIALQGLVNERSSCGKTPLMTAGYYTQKEVCAQYIGQMMPLREGKSMGRRDKGQRLAARSLPFSQVMCVGGGGGGGVCGTPASLLQVCSGPLAHW